MDYFGIGGVPHIMPGRATGLFKDPNVFSTFIIFPAILMLQSLLTGSSKRPILLSIVFMTVIASLFLSFSRGAWINFLLAASLMAILTFALNPQGYLRSRILIIGIAAVIIGFIGILALMSNENVRAMFVERFSLVQSYDTGETGRFGNQMRSIPLLFSSPLGLGPLQFRNHFGLEPHNTFLNAFASYGWLGGVAYLLLFLSTIGIGIKSVFTRSALQPYVIAVFCPMITVMIQGVQIDTDHWRHFYWMLGLLWGLSAVVLREPSRSSDELPQRLRAA
jgi:O-antigen ligase